MAILSSTLIALLFILLFLLCCYYCLKKIGLKKFFPIFLIFTLAIASFFLSPLRKGNSPEITPEYKTQIAAEQIATAAWYTAYKKDLTQIDLIWQRYHRSLSAFSNDEISIQTLFIRLLELEKKLDVYCAQYEKMPFPDALRPETETVLSEIAAKTEDSIQKQNNVIKTSLKRISSDNFKTEPHQRQSEILTKIMVLDTPPTLDIAGEITRLQTLLTIPGEK